MIKKGCLDIVQSKCENCQDCVLGKTRKNVVFSDGNPETAKIVLIGEAPGENEDVTWFRRSVRCSGGDITLERMVGIRVHRTILSPIKVEFDQCG